MFSCKFQISESVDLRSAVRLFLQKGVSSLPVLNGDGKPTAVLTKRDVIALMAAQERSTYKQVLKMPVSHFLEIFVLLNQSCSNKKSGTLECMTLISGVSGGAVSKGGKKCATVNDLSGVLLAVNDDRCGDQSITT